MAESIFRHQEDGGSLSIFASGDLVVFACENGHYWALEAKQESTETVKTAMERVVSDEQADRLFRLF